MKRSELTNFDISKDVTVSRDGDQYCALLGEDLQSGKSGFGETEMESVSNLNLTPEEYSDANIFRVDAND